MAIAFDASSSANGGGGTTLTDTHVCTGANGVLIALFRSNSNANDISGTPTYNSVGMTLVDTFSVASNDRCWVYALLAPSTGSHTISFSTTSSHILNIRAVSYTGVNQSVFPSVEAVAGPASGATSIASVLTPITTNCWHVMGARNDTGAFAPGAGTVERGAGGDSLEFLDSNGTITNGVSHTISATCSSADVGAIGMIIAPVPPVYVTAPPAYDTSVQANSGTVGSNSWTATNVISVGNNSDKIALVGCFFTGSSINNASSVTFGGISMTNILTVNSTAGNGTSGVTLWYLIDPPTGNNTIIFSGLTNGSGGTGPYSMVAYSYYNVSSVTQPDNSGSTSTSTTGSSFSVSITPNAPGCLLWGLGVDRNTVSSYTGLPNNLQTLTSFSGTSAGAQAGDNGSVTNTSQTFTVTGTSAQGIATLVSLRPAYFTSTLSENLIGTPVFSHLSTYIRKFTENVIGTDILAIGRIKFLNLTENIIGSDFFKFLLNGSDVAWTQTKASTAAVYTSLAASAASVWTKGMQAAASVWTPLNKD